MEIKVQKLTPDLQDLAYAKPGDAGFDLRASGVWGEIKNGEIIDMQAEEYVLPTGSRVLVKCGIKLAIPDGYWGNIRDRSGLAVKFGIHTLGGVVDSSYRGEVGVIVINLGNEAFVIKKNERIAQMIISPCVQGNLLAVDELGEETVRGGGGFGSSGRI
ncbi:MAG TPA: dUTP diphosphatase [bacterium]|nr:dUTP diphosphatase [bacterium]